MTEALLKGLLLGLILAISVGPVVFTIIKQSLNNGREGGLSFVAGVWSSDIILVVLSNVFSELVSRLLEHKAVIGYVGSVFLLAMGIYYVFFKKVKLAQDNDSLRQFSGRQFTKLFISGFLVNTLNPSVFLFWLGYATYFSIAHTMEQRIIIFSVCLLINMLADIGKVLLAGKLRKKLTLHNMSVINKVSGTILIGFGIALLYGAYFLSSKI